MCLILFSYKKHPRYPLILAANRDEFYNRPTYCLDYWEDKPDILAGRDGLSGGTWLGVSRQGRFAGVTNFRDPSTLTTDAPSRGLLVSGFLDGEQRPGNFIESIQVKGSSYNGFNLIVGDTNELWYYSNMGHAGVKLDPGIYGLSNAFLNTPWPKVEQGIQSFTGCVNVKGEISVNDLFDMLTDSTLPPDHDLPDTGVGLTWERLLAPMFIDSATYGTRSSAVILADTSGNITFSERSWAKDSSGVHPLEPRTFSIRTSNSDESS